MDLCNSLYSCTLICFNTYIPRYLLFLNTYTGTYDYFELLLQIFFLKPRIKKYYFVDKESIRLQIQLFIRLLYFHSFFIFI